MAAVVAYESRYGSTRRHAERMAAGIGADGFKPSGGVKHEGPAPLLESLRA